MTFPIHITKRHCEGAGLHNEYYEYYEECDTFIDYEVDDDQVHEDIADMIFNSYFKESVEAFGDMCYYQTLCRRQKFVIKLLLTDLDIWEAVEEMYYDDLRQMYQRKYGDE